MGCDDDTDLNEMDGGGSEDEDEYHYSDSDDPGEESVHQGKVRSLLLQSRHAILMCCSNKIVMRLHGEQNFSRLFGRGDKEANRSYNVHADERLTTRVNLPSPQSRSLIVASEIIWNSKLLSAGIPPQHTVPSILLYTRYSSTSWDTAVPEVACTTTPCLYFHGIATVLCIQYYVWRFHRWTPPRNTGGIP